MVNLPTILDDVANCQWLSF